MTFNKVSRLEVRVLSEPFLKILNLICNSKYEIIAIREGKTYLIDSYVLFFSLVWFKFHQKKEGMSCELAFFSINSYTTCFSILNFNWIIGGKVQDCKRYNVYMLLWNTKNRTKFKKKKKELQCFDQFISLRRIFMNFIRYAFWCYTVFMFRAHFQHVMRY